MFLSTNVKQLFHTTVLLLSGDACLIALHVFSFCQH